MNKSQFKALVGGLAAALATLDARMDVLTMLLPPKYAGWLRTIIIVGGVILVLFNQSLSTEHTSLPVAEANALASGVTVKTDNPLASKALSRLREQTKG
jgi:TRAP-type C4-dicarboxylate transport system permease small subunit